MPFIPHTEKDTREMLEAIGAESIEELFDEIPAELRIEHLYGVPEAHTEMEVSRLMRERAAVDGSPLCFIGAGAYDCLLYTSPSPRDGLLSRMPSSA